MKQNKKRMETIAPLFGDLRIKQLRNYEKIAAQLGTLGGGNHFIEIDKGQDGSYWLLVHSGSRNIGKLVAEHYQDLAFKQRTDETAVLRKESIEQYRREGREAEISEFLKKFKPQVAFNKYNAWLEKCSYTSAGTPFDDYLHDLKICQEFAFLNRGCILDSICREMKWKWDESIESVHNYIDMNHEEVIVRKGAVSAYEDEDVLIPLNMRDGTLICKGKGNPDWNFSAPHGAGRLYSRSEAKKSFDMNDFKDSMKGIFSTSVKSDTIDEAPFAYKNYQKIMDAVSATVEIKERILAVYNFKAST
jgi:RNA-splicing ligase RtcB